ncbi:MAG TPA: hypothetical protein VGL40_09200 [Bacillota bacterium]|jgi:hypothetical protein
MINLSAQGTSRFRPVVRPAGGPSSSAPLAVFRCDDEDVVLPTLWCHRGGLRPGDEVEIYVQRTDAGEEIVIRRLSA